MKEYMQSARRQSGQSARSQILGCTRTPAEGSVRTLTDIGGWRFLHHAYQSESMRTHGHRKYEPSLSCWPKERVNNNKNMKANCRSATVNRVSRKVMTSCTINHTSQNKYFPFSFIKDTLLSQLTLDINQEQQKFSHSKGQWIDCTIALLQCCKSVHHCWVNC